MKKTILLFSALLSFGLVKAQDNCATAPSIEADVVYSTSVINGEMPLIFCEGAAGETSAAEWYRYDATENIEITITTSLPGTNGADTRMHVYSGSCDALNCEAGDDDSGQGLTSTVIMNVEAGVSYYVAFDNRYSSDPLEFTLTEGEMAIEELTFSTSTVTVNGSTECVVDMNGDFLDDIVSVTATNIRINFQQEDGSFVLQDFPTTAANHTPSWSIAAGDIDGNGYNDLLYAGGSGVTFMMANDEGTAFEEVSFDQYVFCQRSNFIDINNDGNLDAFVCHDVDPNVFFMNDGTGALTFFQGGLGDTPGGGNYGSVWVDYDNDCDMDLFIAKCRGGNVPENINQMFRNNGNGTFEEVGEEINLADDVQTWSSAWADYDNDGDMDVLIGASSFTNGGHKLMINDGAGNFTDQTAGSGFDTFEGQGIEYGPGDFNNDGFVDVRTSSNIIMLNNGNMVFQPQSVPTSAAAVGDLNNDGFLDFMAGGTIRLNDGNSNNYVKINTIGTASNRNGIGARVKITTAMGDQIRDVRSGDGFAYMSSLTTHFGLGVDTEIERLEICWPSGIVDVLEDLEANTTHNIVEGSTVVSVEEEVLNVISTYPNPAVDVITVNGDVDMKNANVLIFDISGKRVMQTTLKTNTINVAALKAGIYILTIRSGANTFQTKFSKL